MSLIGNWKLGIGNSRSGLHHAYLLKGVKENVLEELQHFLENELNFPTKANPDFWRGEFDTFGIDDARALKETASRKAVGERKVFVLCADFLTREAQNALLKVFEEPVPDTHFFVITSNTESLLPTLRSRLFELSSRKTAACGEEPSFVKEFLSADKKKRLEMVREIIESKDKQQTIEFLNDLETILYDKTAKVGGRTSNQEVFVFEEIQKARVYLNDRAPSIKMLLENISLIIPVKEK